MGDNSNIKLVVVGQTPPPYNGQAKMIKVMLDGLSSLLEVRFVRMAYSDSVSTAGKFFLGKILHLLALVGRSWKALGLGRKRYLYYPPASPNFIPAVRDILFLLAVRPFCRGLILQFHAGGISHYARSHPVLDFFLKKAYGKMALGIVQGASCPDDPGYFGAERHAIVPYGLDIDVVKPRLDAAAPVASVLRILYVGIHTEAKGLFTLLETAKLLLKQAVEFEIHTLGRWYMDAEKERFEQLRSEYGLENRVHSLGQKTGDALLAAYDWADVFFFPTHYPWETMGIVQLEAMAHGLPVIASDWQGPKDVVLDEDTGFLRPHNRPDLFAECLKRLARDAVLRNRLGRAGLERYRSMYTEAAFIGRFVEELSHLKG